MLRIDDLNINYKIIGDGDLVVLLHGWGQNIEMMQPLVGGLKNKKVLIIDLPGFGLSDEPKLYGQLKIMLILFIRLFYILGMKNVQLLGIHLVVK